MALSIGIVAKIDISQNTLNYKEHLKNAYKLYTLLAISVLFLFSILYNYMNQI